MRVFWSFLSLQSFKLDDSYCIGKLTQRITTFMLCIRAISAFMIDKMSVKIGLKIEKKQDLIRNEQTCKKAKLGFNTRSQVTFSKPRSIATCTLFPQVFWPIFLHEIWLEISKQVWNLVETTFESFTSQFGWKQLICGFNLSKNRGLGEQFNNFGRLEKFHKKCSLHYFFLVH